MPRLLGERPSWALHSSLPSLHVCLGSNSLNASTPGPSPAGLAHASLLVSLALLSLMNAARSRVSLDCDSLTKLRVLLGEIWLSACCPAPSWLRGPAMAPTTPELDCTRARRPRHAQSRELTLPSWQTIYAFRYC